MRSVDRPPTSPGDLGPPIRQPAPQTPDLQKTDRAGVYRDKNGRLSTALPTPPLKGTR